MQNDLIDRVKKLIADLAHEYSQIKSWEYPKSDRYMKALQRAQSKMEIKFAKHEWPAVASALELFKEKIGL